MLFHHIGIACKSIDKSLVIYRKLNFRISEIVIDNIQKVKICFVSKENHPLLELIEPFGENSPIGNILAKLGNTPYHNCYQCENIDLKIRQLRGMGFLLVSKPVKAIALENKKICFLYNSDFGLIELMEV